jgi:protein-S-isoprenylcysteine O-methyltransferase Ste14
LKILAPLLVFVAVLLYGLIHSLLASHRAKATARRWFGEATDRWYRLAYNLFGAASFLPVLALPALLPDEDLYTIPRPWVYLTTTIQLLAVLAIAIGILQTGLWDFLGFHQLAGLEEERNHELVVGGLYRWVRHPLYSAGIVFIWLVPVMTRNLLALNLGLTLYLVVGAFFEERKLAREYGVAYRDYKRRTPMFVPGLRGRGRG